VFSVCALLDAARNVSLERHVALLFASGLFTAAGQSPLNRLASGNGIDITAAILIAGQGALYLA
jgi:hypothetical protein